MTDTLLSQRHEGVSDTVSGDPYTVSGDPSPEAAVGGEGAQAGIASDSLRLNEPYDGVRPQAPCEMELQHLHHRAAGEHEIR